MRGWEIDYIGKWIRRLEGCDSLYILEFVKNIIYMLNLLLIVSEKVWGSLKMRRFYKDCMVD